MEVFFHARFFRRVELVPAPLFLAKWSHRAMPSPRGAVASLACRMPCCLTSRAMAVSFLHCSTSVAHKAFSLKGRLDPPRAPLLRNFTAQQRHPPTIEQTPDGFTHLGFVGLLRKLAVSEPRRALPPRAPLLLDHMTCRIIFHPHIEQTPDGKPPGVRSIERRI